MQGIYLDYQATTPVDEHVLELMIRVTQDSFGNPSSTDHSYGWAAEEVINIARGEIAAAIGAKPEEIIFTSGATESNNLALLGFNFDLIITTAIEHKSILDIPITKALLKVDKSGYIDLHELDRSLMQHSNKKILVSVMGANNEIGTINDLESIGNIVKKYNNVLFHSDCAQLLGKRLIDVNKMSLDLMSLSAHKIYGPKGIGALYLKESLKKVIIPLLYGGGQQSGIRPGTLPTPLIAGFGRAVTIAVHDMEQNNKRLISYMKRIVNNKLQLNGPSIEERLPGNLNLTFSNTTPDKLMRQLSSLAVTSSAACTSGGPSHVLPQIGVPENLIKSSVRISLGKYTTDEEVDKATQIIRLVGNQPQA